jgi:undecaprenyl-diphosphatase
VKPFLISLAVCLTLSLVISFAVTNNDNALTRFDHEAVDTLVEHTTATGIDLFKAVTWFGSPALWVINLSAGAYLIWRARRVDLLTGLAVIGGGRLLLNPLKDLVNRARPIWNGAIISESSPAFPSGHAMMSLLTYGFLVIVLWRVIQNRPTRVALISGVAVLVGLIGFSRVYLGVHYPTDVLGGYAIGGTWLSLCLIGKIGGESSRA